MFIRRFSALPSLAVLLAVSGVVLVDAPPARPVNAAPFGKIIVVGEFEDGEFNVPTELLTSSDQATKFGLFGYTYGSQKHQYPCAKQSGGSEPWNGNGWLQTARLVFGGGLVFCRVDSSIGEVTLTPRAFVEGTLKGPFALDDGLTFQFKINGGSTVTVTFAATAAVHTATSGTYNAFTGGEVLELAIDDGATFEVVFQAGDDTLAEIISRINATYGATIASNASGELRITSLRKGTASRVYVKASSTAATLGLTSGSSSPADDEDVSGTGDAADISLMTFAELKAKVDAAGRVMTTGSAGFPRLVSTAAGTGSVQIVGGTAAALLGFVAGDAVTAALPSAISLPAGLRCSDGGADATRVVTMQTKSAAAGSTASINVKVRPAVDDGTYAGVAADAIDTMEDKPGDLEWSVTNNDALTAALTASQLDSRYLAAIDATLGITNDATKKANGILSARQSNAIRARLRQNALDASANGHFGRRAFLCPPNGTSATTIIGSAAPGVGATRAEEVAYAAGGVRCFYQELIDGGHSTDGVAVRHPDALLAARWGSLTPGYNPGQLPEEPVLRYSPSLFPGLETVAQSWDLTTYAAFKRAGICGAFFDAQNGVTFEQGVTSVDPSADPSRVDISRKTLADFIGDSCASFLLPQAKRQGTVARRERQRAAIEGFLDSLVGDTVEDYQVSLVDGQATGVLRWDVAVTPVQSDDVILFNLSVGPNAVELSRG
jgi:hypothetical protein